MNILAIETSCDETAAAIISGDGTRPKIISNVVSSQIDIHKKYGGVVPEVAARSHIENIVPVITESLKQAKINKKDINAIAVTYGPGLIGSLVVGVETAKALSLTLDIPLVGINHLEGHIYANFLDNNERSVPEFPLIALLVSGGHSMLIHMKDHLNYEVIGETRDDAAGEAFDKVSKVIGLGYPGGPIISQRALLGDRKYYKFPVIDLTPDPKRDQDGYLRYPEPSLDFSFSGLKTAVISTVKKEKELSPVIKNNIAASFEKAVVDTLVKNSIRAIKKYNPKTFILSGGVAANRLLREELAKNISIESPETSYVVPSISLCTDNAAMIGAVAFYSLKNKKNRNLNIVSEPNLKL